MRSNNVYRNGPNISRLVIKEEEGEEEHNHNEIIEINMSRDRPDNYSHSVPAIQLPQSSIIRTHHGKFFRV